jgi:hypothetical protein
MTVVAKAELAQSYKAHPQMVRRWEGASVRFEITRTFSLEIAFGAMARNRDETLKGRRPAEAGELWIF